MVFSCVAASVYVEVSSIVFDDKVIPQCILVKLFKQRAYFFLCWISAASMAHIINDLVKMTESNVYENHRMEAGAMSI